MTPVEKTASDLEWSLLLDHLAQLCVTHSGASRARALLPAATFDDARDRMRRTAEAMSLLADGAPIPASGVAEQGDFLARLARGAIATAAELHSLRQLLRVAHTLRRFAAARRDTHTAISHALASDPSLDRMLETLDFAIDVDGGIADRASSELAHARRKAGELRQRVIGRLEELIARYADVLQDRYYTLREGRYVLPVRFDAHIRVNGIVLGSSASGATLFIEPSSVTSLGNQLKVAMADVEREEARVLIDLSERARGQIDALEGAWQASVTADLLAAIARFGAQMNAIAVAPENAPVLALRAMRHPRLALTAAEVVPNDLEVASGRVLVISGPNAGGKTVALECLGLAAMMVRTGLPLPVAEGSRAGWFDPVLSDVGDDQSLTRSLSTFSAHVTNLAAILEHGRSSSLVLLDELAGGTDPQEGAALAAAVLDRLASQGSAVAVTTHYELLKTLAVTDPRFLNASVGFDLVRMLPTFRVTVGIPGASSALAVASRYGIPHEVIERARELLPEHAIDREDVLRKLHDEQAAAQMARHSAEEDAREATRVRAELESERNLSRAREEVQLSREGRELLDALRRAREEIRMADARVRRKRVDAEDVRAAERAVDAVAARVAIGGALAGAVTRAKHEPDTTRHPAREDELVPGVRAYVARIGADVDVIDRPLRGQVRVAAGPLKLFVAIEDVSIRADTKPLESAQKRHRAALPEPLDDAPPTPLIRGTSNTCDVRGLRADDATSMVDAFIDRLASESERAGFVLHGHGTGALRLAVRGYLGESPFVARWSAADAEQGGEALTAFWLKD